MNCGDVILKWLKEFVMRADEVLDRVKQLIIDLEPNAEVFLFGSRAKGTTTQESDWAFSFCWTEMLMIQG